MVEVEGVDQDLEEEMAHQGMENLEITVVVPQAEIEILEIVIQESHLPMVKDLEATDLMTMDSMEDLLERKDTMVGTSHQETCLQVMDQISGAEAKLVTSLQGKVEDSNAEAIEAEDLNLAVDLEMTAEEATSVAEATGTRRSKGSLKRAFASNACRKVTWLEIALNKEAIEAIEAIEAVIEISNHLAAAT